MGFRLNRTYVLKFEGALAGAEVKLRATSVATMLKLRGFNFGSGMESTQEAARLLAEHVVEWNLEDEKGEKLAFTADSIIDNLEEPVLMEILIQWAKAAAGVTAPLDGPSTSGEQFPEGNIPMAEL